MELIIVLLIFVFAIILNTLLMVYILRGKSALQDMKITFTHDSEEEAHEIE